MVINGKGWIKKKLNMSLWKHMDTEAGTGRYSLSIYIYVYAPVWWNLWMTDDLIMYGFQSI